MQHLKIPCINCTYYKKCSQQTRMYVNYCGPRMKTLKSKIDKAFAECRVHRGLLYKYEVLIPMNSFQKAAQLNLSAV